MKMIVKICTMMCLGLMLVSACNPAETRESPTAETLPSGEADLETLRQIIQEKNNIVASLYKSGNIDSAATYFAPAVKQMPPNVPMIEGREQFISVWKQNMEAGEWDFAFTVEEIEAAGDLAMERGSYTMSLAPSENSPYPPMEDSGNYLVLWKKIDGDWKILWDVPSSTVPMDRTME